MCDGTFNSMAATEPNGQETPMEVFGFVHLLVGDGDFSEWRQAMSRRGWNSLVYSHCDQVWRPKSPDLYECIVIDLDRVPLETLVRYANYPASSPVLVIADPSNLELAIESVRRGAWDVVLKPVVLDQLVCKIGAAFEKERQNKMSDLDWRGRCQSLSPREHEVMQLLLDACNTTQIAHRLGINSKTAEKHRLRVLEKLNMQSVAELLRRVFCHRSSVSESNASSAVGHLEAAYAARHTISVGMTEAIGVFCESTTGIS
jgi:FixJ family two-component response regulator